MNSPLSHYSDVAALHIQEIHHGMLAYAGSEVFWPDFIPELPSRPNPVSTCHRRSKILGFIAGTADIRSAIGLYSSGIGSPSHSWD